MISELVFVLATGSGNGRDRRRGGGYERGVERLRVCIGFASEALLEGYG